MVSSSDSIVPLPPDVSRGHGYVAVQWSLVSVATILVMLRFCVRGMIRKQVGGDDYTILAALVCVFAVTPGAPEGFFDKNDLDMCLGPERFGYPSGQRRIRSTFSIPTTCPNDRNDSIRPCHYNIQHRWHLSGQDFSLFVRVAAPTFHPENLPLVRHALRLAPTEPHVMHSQL